MSDSVRNVDHTPYNQIAGRSVERLAAISDGIFAVAMTLLVLDLKDPKDPACELIHRDREAVLRRVIGAQALYAAGALLCVINTYVSIAVIVLIQLNFAVGPKILWLSRI